MADITIPLDSPALRPLVAEKTFSQAYIMSLSVCADSVGEPDFIFIRYVPFDKATGERLLTDEREIRLPLWKTINDVPEVAIAFAAIAAAVPALVAYQKA